MRQRFLFTVMIMVFFSRLLAQEKSAMQYIDLFQEYEYTDSLKAKAYLIKAAEQAENTQDSLALARLHRAWGWYFEDRRMLAHSLREHLLSIDLYMQMGNQQGEADGFGNLGIVYDELLDFKKSIHAYYKSASINERILLTTHDEKAREAARRGLAAAYSNLGAVYTRLEELHKAIELHLKALRIEEELDDKDGLGLTYANLGIAYRDIGNLDRARYYLQRSLALKKTLRDRYTLPAPYISLGVLYNEWQQPDTALRYLDTAAKISLENGNRQDLCFVYSNMARAYKLKGKLAKAEELAVRALELARSVQEKDHAMSVTRQLAEIYAALGRYDQAYRYLDRYLGLKDTLNASDFEKEMVREAVNFDFTKRILADSLRKVKEDEVTQVRHEQEIRQQKTYLYYGIAAFLITAVFAVYMIRANRQKKKTNLELEHKNEIIVRQHNEAREQKEIIEQKQKEIIDSINYAKRIQNAILAEEQEIKKYFPQSFLLYRPKDIVAGDFYFFERAATHVFYAAADCTGHGVPGALVSVVCANALGRCVKEFGLTDPGQILDKTRELVTDTFKKSGREVKDGMDISLVSVALKDLENTAGQPPELCWAGANNPLWLISQTGELTEIKPDKQPIGISEKTEPFATHRIKPEPGTCIYLFTDGYADQFGGEKGKKLKSKNLQELLKEMVTDTPAEQGQKLGAHFEKWKGQLEQADDVCIIGIKV